MKLAYHFLAGAFLVGFSLPMMAQSVPAHERYGVEHPVNDITHIAVRNYQDENLGQVTDMVVDLVNGRLVEVLVKADSALNVGGKIVAVPPRMLAPDSLSNLYRLNVSTDMFKGAPAVDVTNWTDANRGDRIAAAYRHFGWKPYFLERGQTADNTARWPRVPLGYVERTSHLINMPVGNLQNQNLGTVFSLILDIPKGRITNVTILSPGDFKTKSVVPAMALSFNTKRNALLLNESKMEFADEPRYVFTDAANGNEASFQEETYSGPHTQVPLEQGSDQYDVNITISINSSIRAPGSNGRNVEVGTVDGRVTLRGTVPNAEDKARIFGIAVAATRPEHVDDQILVREPGTAN